MSPTRTAVPTARTIKVAAVPDWIDLPGAAQLAQVRRTVTMAGKRPSRWIYLITFADPTSAPPSALATWVQGHRRSKTSLHYAPDVTFGENDFQVRTEHAPRIMVPLCNTVINLLHQAGWDNTAKALRHHARDPE